jgi:uncharacterized protein YdhG (YjbR/CyaY superfamily)
MNKKQFMTSKKTKPQTIDEYIAGFPKNVQKMLQEIRLAIKKAAPSAEETISYMMPAFSLKGSLVYFAAYKNHIGFYPTASGIESFKKEISAYEWAKGSVQFPLDKPMPLALVSKIVKFRVKENLERAVAKAKKTKAVSVKKPNTAMPTKPSEPDKVNTYMKALKHPLKKEAEALRQIILSADKSIGEEIYWNAPCFFYTGAMKPFNPKEYKRFIVCFNFFKKDCIRLIFLTGAKVNDTTGFLQGDYADGRRLALFYNMNEVRSNEKILQKLIKKWLKLLDK